MKYIIAIGIFQALAAAVLLWRSRIRNHADGILIGLLTFIALHLSIKFCIYSFVTDVQVLSMMNTFIGFCYVPLLYLYTLKIVRPDFIPASRWYVFIPFLIAAIAFFSVASVLATGAMSGYIALDWYNTVTLWTMIPMDIALAGWVVYYAKKHLNKISYERKLIVQLAFLFLITSILSILFMLAKPFGFNYNYLARSVIYTLLIVICIRILTYRYSALIHSPRQFVSPISVTASGSAFSASAQGETLSLQTELSTALRVSPERKRERLGMDEMMCILLKLEAAMVADGYYKDSELTLDKLASLTKFSKYDISQTLNHFLHKPFYTFVNEYRIQHVKERITHLSKRDIEINVLSIAYDAGFNSKSSFNRYFKEMVGQTPTAYFKTISQQVEMAT